MDGTLKGMNEYMNQSDEEIENYTSLPSCPSCWSGLVWSACSEQFQRHWTEASCTQAGSLQKIRDRDCSVCRGDLSSREVVAMPRTIISETCMELL